MNTWIFALAMLWPLSGLGLYVVLAWLMLRWDRFDITYILMIPVALVTGPLLSLVLRAELSEHPTKPRKP